jgi:hypothetical protein
MTYYSENREHFLQYNINYYWTHRDEKRIYNAHYYETNKENIYINRKITAKRRRQMKIIKEDKFITIKFN